MHQKQTCVIVSRKYRNAMEFVRAQHPIGGPACAWLPNWALPEFNKMAIQGLEYDSPLPLKH